MSLFRTEDYLAGITAILFLVAVSQLALWLGRNARVRHDEEHQDH
ncbi:MAG TPA: hypothetical protein VEG36_04420 [Burkholderiales bacterium]|nr:hypothetical protein [Burkholderiales bacterium]